MRLELSPMLNKNGLPVPKQSLSVLLVLWSRTSAFVGMPLLLNHWFWWFFVVWGFFLIFVFVFERVGGTEGRGERQCEAGSTPSREPNINLRTLRP